MSEKSITSKLNNSQAIPFLSYTGKPTGKGTKCEQIGTVKAAVGLLFFCAYRGLPLELVTCSQCLTEQVSL
jgi:hypothetical protein